MPGANTRNQAPQLVAGGDVYPSRFVMLSTAADNTALGCTAGSPPIGISQSGTKYPITNPTGQLGGGTITGPGIAAEATDMLQIFSLGDVCWLECGGTVAAGDLLEAAGTTTNVGRGITSGPGRNYGALALEAGTVGQLIRVQIILKGGGGVSNNAIATTTRTILAGESGGTIFLAGAAGVGFVVTLPAPALGLKLRFVVTVAPTSVGYVITSTPTDILTGIMVERAGGAGQAGSLADTLTFNANASIVGDWVEMVSDGTLWYYGGMVDVIAGVTAAG